MALDTISEVKSDAAILSVSEASAAVIVRASQGVVEIRSRGRGVGAGIIWDPAGRIMTNHHVVVGTGGNPYVILNDGRRHDTRLIAENPALDLALLEVDATDLPALPVGDSTKLRVGELVFALGHPWGQKGVVTAGIVSGVGTITGARSGRSADYIRSDVSLAPGNSGGPLINARGEVVGINSMIFGGDLSVAVPAHVALDWLEHTGKRVYLGVGVRPVRINRARTEGAPVGGVIIVEIDRLGPATRAGLRVGDIVLSVAEQTVVDTASLRKALVQGVSNGKAELLIVRDDRASKIEVTFDTPGK